MMKARAGRPSRSRRRPRRDGTAAVPDRARPARRQDRARDGGGRHRDRLRDRQALRRGGCEGRDQRPSRAAAGRPPPNGSRRCWAPSPIAVPCDVTVESDVQRMFDTVGDFDVLVNNAGLGGTAPLADMTDEQWRAVVDVTLNGTMRCTREALKRLQAQRPRWRDREQRVGDRLAGAGRPGALRGGQGRGDGADPRRGRGSGRVRRAGERGRAVVGNAREPGQGDDRRAAGRADRRARRSVARPSRGRSRT